MCRCRCRCRCRCVGSAIEYCPQAGKKGGGWDCRCTGNNSAKVCLPPEGRATLLPPCPTIRLHQAGDDVYADGVLAGVP